jgi:hypothetical protein
MRALLFVSLLAAPVAAAPADELTFGSQVRALPSNSADALTGDSLVGPGLGLGRALAIDLPARFALWADAGIGWAGAKGSMFHTLGTDLFDMTLTAGAHLRYRPYRNLAVGAGVALGAQHASLDITDSMGNTASDTGWGAIARASLQVDLLAVDLPRFALGLRGEVGYLAASGIELVPRQDRSDGDTLYIPMQEASLGHLDLGGPFATIGLVSQF